MAGDARRDVGTSRKIHQAYYLPSMTGIASVVYENEAASLRTSDVTRAPRQMAHQLDGIEKLRHVSVHIERSVQA